MSSPFASVKEKFGDKAKLVAELEKFTRDDLWVSRENKAKGLSHVSNAKLLRLHATFSAVKEKFGTRVKLIDAILELEKRTKDEGYKSRLTQYPVPRLWDLYKSTAKRVGAASAENGGAKAKKSAAGAAKSATAKKPAGAKKASTKKEAGAKA